MRLTNRDAPGTEWITNLDRNLNEPPIRFGILGTGRITRRLVADLQSNPAIQVTAIGSRTETRARWAADALAIPHAVAGYRELLSRDDIDAVYVALPPSLHEPVVLEAIERGKHVLCEKPLTLNLAQSQSIDQAAQRANVCWLDATAWLHHERTISFANWIETAEQPLAPEPEYADDDEPRPPRFRLGRLRHISTAVSFPNPFQSNDHRLDSSLGGGCLLDLGWYAAGAMVWATGQLPIEVHADLIERNGVPFRVSAILRFPDDVTGTLSCGFDTTTRKWFEIAGEEASIICDDFTRPWANKPARCWIHEASGTVHTFEFSNSQEHRMIARLVSRIRNHVNAPESESAVIDEDFRNLQLQALRTQATLDQLKSTSQSSSNRISGAT